MCRKLIYLIFFVSVLAIGSLAQADLPEWETAINDANPLHWYKFNETTGTDCIDSGSAGLNGVYSGVSLNQEGYFGAGTAARFDRSGENRVNFTGSTDLDSSWTAEYIVKNMKPAAANDAQAFHDSGATSVRLSGWTSLGEAGFTLYGVADYRFTPEEGLTLEDLVIPDGEWMHLVWRRDDSGNTQLFFNGKLVGTSTDSVPLPRERIGSGGGGADMLDAFLDESVVFGRALTDAVIIAHAAASSLLDQSVLGASNPTPADGVIYEDTWANLGWSPGPFAVSHDVYFGENFDNVNDGTADTFRGNQPSTSFIVGFVGFPYPDGLVPGITYYWRVDEVEADGTIQKGNVWSFMVPPKTAYNPNPPDGVKFVVPDVELSWTAGFGAKLHTVYFGDNFDDVNNAVVGIPQPTTTHTPGTLEMDKTYYWRVDEFDAVTTHKGDVWSFRTLPVIPISDPSLVGWWTLDEGMGATALDWSGHDNHGTLEGDLQWLDGYDGGALEFDGANDTVTFGTGPALSGTTDFSVAAWIKTSKTSAGVIIQQRNGGYNGEYRFMVNGSGQLSLMLYGDGDYQYDFSTTKTVNDGNWHHAVFVRQDSSGSIYIDGNIEASDSGTLRNLDSSIQVAVGADIRDSINYFSGIIDDVRIYNKALTQEEIQLTMRGDPLVAWGPNPTNGSTLYIRDATPLSWSPGDNASQHDVYFGTDRDAVADADASDTTGIYRGRQGVTIYTPPDVEWGGGPYYWRVDEYNTDATISKGNVWSFTVANFIGIDDIEDYNDYPPDEIFSTWIDGWEVPTNGSMAGHAEPPFAETGNVHGGRQSMPVYYENNFKYSEITMTLVWPRNWTEEGVGVLSLWFCGDASNAAERMYVALNGSAVVYHDNPDAALIDEWTEWTIDLQEFAAQGVNLANVNTISIGFGDKNNLQAGGSGMVLFDDIRLYRPPAP